MTNIQAFMKNFLGASPEWYKLAIVVFLIINPIVFFFISLLLRVGYWLQNLFSHWQWH